MACSMRKTSCIIIVLGVALLLLVGCTRVKEEYYPDGILRSRIEYRNGKENGLATFYQPNGMRVSEIEMKDGKKNGSFRTFYSNGNIESEATYQNDSLVGIQSFFDIDGALVESVTYASGKKNGEYRVWHARDLVQTIGYFKNDLWDGHWEYYDGRGFLVGEGDFDEGTGILTNYNSQGMKHKITHYVHNKKEGDEVYYDAQGNEIKRITFKEDKILTVNGQRVERDSVND